MFFDDNFNDYLDMMNNDKNTVNNYETIILDNSDMENYMIGSYDNVKRDNNIDLENGFYLGNIFTDTYKSYKNKKPKRINAYSERDKLLLKIQELDFIINDLNLYLDINPNDKKLYDIFKGVAIKLDKLKEEYYKKYQVLELCKDINNKYTWLDNPWSWDGEANV